jgi:hypothetical protein
VSTGDREQVFVLTDDGWRCYRYSYAESATR